MNIHKSAGDYLKAILKLRENHGMARSIDVVRELVFSRPGVSVVMKNLRENGYTKPKPALLDNIPGNDILPIVIFRYHG